MVQALVVLFSSVPVLLINSSATEQYQKDSEMISALDWPTLSKPRYNMQFGKIIGIDTHWEF